MNTHTFTFRSRKAQLGVTIIELMVALLLGLLLTGGAIQLFVSNRATYGFNEGFARLQENGRFALDTLSYHTRLAGYFGCLPNVQINNNLNAPTVFPFNFEQGLRGFEANGTNPAETYSAPATDPANSSTAGDWTPNLPAPLIGSVIPSSDVLVVHHASATSHALVSPYNDSAQVFVDAASTDWLEGELGIVSDCQKSSIFQITSVSAGGPPINMSHSNASMTPGNSQPVWPGTQQYGPGAELLRPETWVYYVGARAGGGPPVLYQRRLQLDPATDTVSLIAEEMVEGVETMQVRYGIDATQDGTIDSYETADTVSAAEWPRVATVRLSFLVRSPEEYGTEVDNDTYVVDETIFNPVDDRRIRQVFTTTIAIRNRLP
jgi:type IV pilus assembly protein PilW